MSVAASMDRGDDPVRTVDGVVVTKGSSRHISSERVAREEPLEIRLAGFQVAVTMRTPGHDFDLITGFLITEGILEAPAEIDSMAYCPDAGHDGASNIVNVNVRDPQSVDPTRWQRNFYASSSCGVCGKASIDLVRLKCSKAAGGPSLSLERLYRMQSELETQQPVFRETGGLHAAAVADSQHILVVREDVGRHNAVDKSIGAVLRSVPQPESATVLLVSGRASFEIVQKALMAGIPVVAAVSAPSSLAVDLARETGLTLLGFVRGHHCNIYSGPERVVTE